MRMVGAHAPGQEQKSALEMVPSRTRPIDLFGAEDCVNRPLPVIRSPNRRWRVVLDAGISRARKRTPGQTARLRGPKLDHDEALLIAILDQ
jgi:hypothetical protein